MNGGAGHWPILLIELLLVLGGVLVFAWWQLRDLDRERRESARRRAAQAQDARSSDDVEDAHETDPMAHPDLTAAAPAVDAAGPADASAAAVVPDGQAADPTRRDRGA